MTNSKIQIPVISIIPGIGDSVRQQLSSSTASSLVNKLYQSNKLEIIDLPLPVVFPPGASNNFQPKGAVGQTAPTTPEWKLDLKQQQVLEDAEILFMDAHMAAPLLLAPKTNLSFELQHLLQKVKWVQGTYAGVDAYHQFPEVPADPGFTVSRARGIMPTALAQFVFGYVIAIERKLFEAKEFQEQHVFGRWDLKYRSFRQLTIGILGLGEVGQEIGRTLKASGFQVAGFKRRVSDEDKKALTSCADLVSTDLSEVLEQSDYIVNVLPSTDATRYLLTENTLEVCRKKKPVFINVGRGDIIAEKTIVNALEKGLLSKAVLDVFEKEPLPKDSPLWSHSKVIVTPHITYCRYCLSGGRGGCLCEESQLSSRGNACTVSNGLVGGLLGYWTQPVFPSLVLEYIHSNTYQTNYLVTGRSQSFVSSIRKAGFLRNREGV